MRKTLIAALLASLAVMAGAEENLPPKKNADFSHRDLAREAVIVDLHSDAMDRVYAFGNHTSTFAGETLESSLPKLIRAGVKVQFFAIWDKPGQGPEEAEIILDNFQRCLTDYSDKIAFAGSYADIVRNLKDGKISALLTVENGGAFAGDIKRVDYFYKRGVRLVTLTWNHANEIGDAAKERRDPGGLTPFGKKVIQRMNELGMIVDVSHASDRTARDAIALSKTPVIASHSNSRVVKPHPRNLSDGLVREICGRGGIVGAAFHRTFLTYNKTATVSDVADHIEHLAKIGGVECVALGSDFDGGIFAPQGLENMGKLENLTGELIRRGFTREQLELIYGQNALRLIRAVLGP